MYAAPFYSLRKSSHHRYDFLLIKYGIGLINKNYNSKVIHTFHSFKTANAFNTAIKIVKSLLRIIFLFCANE